MPCPRFTTQINIADRSSTNHARLERKIRFVRGIPFARERRPFFLKGQRTHISPLPLLFRVGEGRGGGGGKRTRVTCTRSIVHAESAISLTRKQNCLTEPRNETMIIPIGRLLMIARISFAFLEFEFRKDDRLSAAER